MDCCLVGAKPLSETKIKIHTFLFKNIHLKILSVKWRPFCLSLNVLSSASSWATSGFNVWSKFCHSNHCTALLQCCNLHDDGIKWKHFLRYWPFARGIHRSPVDSLHKGQWCTALMFSLICAWTNVWANNWDAGDLRRHHAQNDITVMSILMITSPCWIYQYQSQFYPPAQQLTLASS